MEPNMDDLLAALADVVGDGGMLTGTDVSSRASGIWRSQGIEAKAILRPRSTEEVSRILAICDAARQPLVAQGGLTGLVEGHITQAGEIVLSLERMNAIEEVNPVERTMTVQAGVVLEAVHDAAEKHGLMYPLDIGGRGSCTLGGNIATNAGGNRVIRYGMTRDMVLGVEAVLADGTVVSSMNHMIKNNAGYDLKQLFIGTEGSLGIVTRAVLRLREKPRSQETMLVAVSDFDRVTALLKAMDAGLGGTLSAFEVLWNNFYRLVTTPPATRKPPLAQDYPFYVLIEAMGGDPQADHARIEAVFAEAHESGLIEDAVIATSEAQRQELWAMRDDVEQVHQYKPVFIFDVSLRVSDMYAYVAEVNRGTRSYFREIYELRVRPYRRRQHPLRRSGGGGRERPGRRQAGGLPTAQVDWRLGVRGAWRRARQEEVPPPVAQRRGNRADAHAETGSGSERDTQSGQDLRRGGVARFGR